MKFYKMKADEKFYIYTEGNLRLVLIKKKTLITGKVVEVEIVENNH